jgi:hypothetical protein
VKIEAIRLGNQLENWRLTKQAAPPRLVRAAYDDVAHAMILGKYE